MRTFPSPASIGPGCNALVGGSKWCPGRRGDVTADRCGALSLSLDAEGAVQWHRLPYNTKYKAVRAAHLRDDRREW
jgi:hypothetical protein